MLSVITFSIIPWPPPPLEMPILIVITRLVISSRDALPTWHHHCFLRRRRFVNFISRCPVTSVVIVVLAIGFPFGRWWWRLALLRFGIIGKVVYRRFLSLVAATVVVVVGAATVVVVGAAATMVVGAWRMWIGLLQNRQSGILDKLVSVKEKTILPFLFSLPLTLRNCISDPPILLFR